MKNRCDMRRDKLCDRGNPCRTLSQGLIAKVEPGSTFTTACIATWETQVASWALANHVCFPLVALDLRQNSINRPSLSHVATTCRVPRVAAILMRMYKSGLNLYTHTYIYTHIETTKTPSICKIKMLGRK